MPFVEFGIVLVPSSYHFGIVFVSLNVAHLFDDAVAMLQKYYVGTGR